MEEIRIRLEGMRGELRRDVASDVAVLSRSVDDKGEDSTPSQHPADVASDLYAREELVAEQVTLERELVEVDEALARIADGTYGRCVDCGAEIGKERLAALPQAPRCIGCQRAMDRRQPR
jgi:DnaK suppressor protein